MTKTVDDLMKLHEFAVYAIVRLGRGGTIEAAKASDEVLRSALEEVVKDHLRYRYLLSMPSGCDAARLVNDEPEGVNAAIDAAMKRFHEQEGVDIDAIYLKMPDLVGRR